MTASKTSKSSPLSGKSGNSAGPKPKKAGGGTAAAGGINFQAVVTAFVEVHLLSGKPLAWLAGIADDTPIGVWAESEGPGDDLRIELADGRIVEVQAKKGLKKGAALWEALDALAYALANGGLDFGVLAVASDSSGTVRKQLADDIERLGQGREDMLTDIGKEWLERLRRAELDVVSICSRLRIRVVHGLGAEDADRRLAVEMLRHVCADSGQANQAWATLFEDAVTMMEQRGRTDLPRLVRLLRSHGVALKANDDAAGIAIRLADWVKRTRDGFTLSAIRKRLPLSALIPMHTVRIPFELPPAENAQKALARYHDGTLGRSRDDEEYDAEWTGRFKFRAVVQAGPGLGKSTLATKLAHEYAVDGFPVLHVSLKPIAAAMARGEPFDRALKTLALDGSNISLEALDRARLADFVVIADGLDDCGPQHEAVAAALNSFSIGHPHARMIVTTRPIGYATAQLSEWPHYRLIGPSSSSGTPHLARLLKALAEGTGEDDPYDLARKELQGTSGADAISISPLMLGMAASLIHRRGHLPETRPKLYDQLIALFESESDVVRPAGISALVAAHVLNLLGWAMVEDPLLPRARLIERFTNSLAQALGVPKLAAAGQVETALAYWERAGLVEVVHHDGLELLTFVHKTFAEFAAARYVVALDQGERDRELARIIELPDLAEVTGFVSGLGHGNDIARLFLARGVTGSGAELERALRIAIDPDAKVDDTLALKLVELAFEAIGANVSKKFEIGLAIVALAKSRPALLAAPVTQRQTAEDSATRLTAWSATIALGSAHYDPTELEAVLADLLPDLDTLFPKRGGFVLKPLHDHELVGPIGIAALEAQPVKAREAFAERYLKHEAFGRTTTLSRIDSILKKDGLSFSGSQALERRSRDMLDRYINPPEEERRLHNRALRALAAAVALDEDSPEPKPTYPAKRFLQFAGYQRLSCFGEVGYDDLKTWTAPYDEASVSSAMRTMASISTLDMSILAVEAREIVRFLDTNPSAKPFELMLPDVDIPEVDWSKAASLSLDMPKIETALRHGSEWLAFVAGNLLEAVDLSETDVRRILDGAQDAPLWAGAEIALEKLPAPIATNVLLDRLVKPLPRGSRFLFAALRRLPLDKVTDKIGVALALGLDDRFVSTVEQAAGLALDLASKGERIDATWVRRSYDAWQAHEQKRDDKHVQWPSPLETLLKLRIALGDVDDDALAVALGDHRSDVRKVAEEERERRDAR